MDFTRYVCIDVIMHSKEPRSGFAQYFTQC